MKEKKKPKGKKYRPLMRFGIFCKKITQKRIQVVGNTPDGGCVYLVRHLDTLGVTGAFTALPVVMRPWVLDTFTSYEDAKKQFKEYTFSVRMGKSKAFCALASPLAARAVVSFVRSARAIPVYRKDKAARSIATIKQSVQALEQGDNLLIFPDVEYADVKESEQGEIYRGFCAVDKLFYRRNQTHIRFIPVYMSKSKAVVHDPVFFDGNQDEAFDKIVRGIYNP